MIRTETQPTILAVSPYPVRREEAGGVSNLVKEQKSALAAKGYKVEIVGPYTKDPDNIADHFFGRAIPGIPLNNTIVSSAVSINRKRAQEILLAVKPDFLIFEEPGAAPLATFTMMSAALSFQERSPIRIVRYHAQNETFGLASSFILEVCRATGIYRAVRNAIEGRIVVSKDSESYWQRIDPGQYRVIHNGIDTRELTPDGRTLDCWNDGSKTIFFFGRHDPRKGIKYLLEAYAQIRRSGTESVKLKIAGGGQETRRLRRLAYDLQLPDVEFLGLLPRNELVDCIRSCDLVVAPSVGGEGFGRVIIEALAVGKLVVASDINGYREAAAGQSFAHLAKPKDAQSLAAGITYMLRLPEDDKRSRQKQAREYAVENFDWDVISDQTLEYLESLRMRRRAGHHVRPG